MLDGNARLNVATFVTTWMEPQAEQLMAECLDKNMIDKDEYPQTAAIETRCVNILADLWHAPETNEASGCSTTGSSEAAMLGGLALKRRWRNRRLAAGLPADRPNIVMGMNVQVCWEKFANYWDVEMRLVPMEGDRYNLSAEEAVARCDENTIGVVAILGSTFDGSYEPVAEICAALDAFEEDRDRRARARRRRLGRLRGAFHRAGLRLGLPPAARRVDQHVGPQVRARLPGRRLDRLARCRRATRRADLPRQLPRRHDADIRAQLLTAGRTGGRAVLQLPAARLRGVPARAALRAGRGDRLAARLEELGPFELLTRGDELPVFAVTLKPGVENYTVFDLSLALRERGWQVPAYTFPENRTDLAACASSSGAASRTTWPTFSSRT